MRYIIISFIGLLLFAFYYWVSFGDLNFTCRHPPAKNDIDSAIKDSIMINNNVIYRVSVDLDTPRVVDLHKSLKGKGFIIQHLSQDVVHSTEKYHWTIATLDDSGRDFFVDTVNLQTGVMPLFEDSIENYK